MNKLKEIVIAYAKMFQEDPEDVERATLRYEKCKVCEYRKMNLLDFEICEGCGCILAAKIFTPAGREACPLNKWED